MVLTLRKVTLVLLLSLSCLLGQTGTITGRITMNNGAPYVGATVLITRTTAPPFNTTVFTGDDGSYQASELPTGSYRVCPDLPSSQYISPCIWLDPSAVVPVPEGQVVAVPPMQLQLGSTLHVAVADPGSLLPSLVPSMAGKSTGSALVLGVWGPDRHFHLLAPVKTTGVRTQYQLTIPFETALRLQVLPIGLGVLDAKNVSLPSNGQKYDVIHHKGDPNPPSFQFSTQPPGN